VKIAEMNLEGAREWTALLEERLGSTLDALALDSQSRDASRFENVLSGAAGVGGPYDAWRRFAAIWRREEFQPEHSQL
jgi:hypothetical protein